MTAPSFNRYSASGSTDTFSVPFAYLDKSHVNVAVNGVLVAPANYTWPNSGSVKLTAGNPVAGVVVFIYRQTPVDPLTTFVPGNLDAGDLNVAVTQPLFVAQEAYDISVDTQYRAFLSANFGAGGTFPSPAADKIIGWNAAGTALENKTVIDLGAVEIIDEDDMASNSDSKVPTQQSVKAYVDAGDLAGVAYSDTKATRVANRTEAKALDPTKTALFQIAGEGGRNGLFIYVLTSSLSAAEAAAAAADTLEGIYFTNGLYTAVRQAGWLITGADARWWGVANDYNSTTKAGTSIHTAVNAALAVVDWVRLPAGKMLLTDAIALPATKKLTGAGRTLSLVYVNSGFNMSAAGVVVFTSGSSHTLGGIQFICQDQPSSTLLANYIAYPPVISAVGRPGLTLFDLSILEAYIGIDMTGNCGNTTIDNLQMSFYFKGIKIDGSLDSIKISRLHMWPFGFSSDANKMSVMHAARGIESFRADDFHLSDSLIFSVKEALYFGSSGLGSTFGSITGVDLDDAGGLIMSAGSIIANGCFFTLGKTDSQHINLSGGTLVVSGSSFNTTVATASNKAIYISGGRFVMTGCQSISGSFDDNTIAILNAPYVTIVGNDFTRTNGVAYTTALIQVSGAAPRVNISNNMGLVLTTGTSQFVNIGSTGATGVVMGNVTPLFTGGFGWSYVNNSPGIIMDNNHGLNGQRGVIASILAADRAGADVATVQNVFASTEDEITLDATTAYEFEAQYVLSRAAGTTSHTFATLFGGTATFTSIDYVAEITNPTGNVLSNSQMIHATAATATVLTAANTSATEYIVVKLRGEMRINATGTVIPQFQYSAAPGGAPTIKRNSFFRIKPMGLNTMVSQGPWS